MAVAVAAEAVVATAEEAVAIVAVAATEATAVATEVVAAIVAAAATEAEVAVAAATGDAKSVLSVGKLWREPPGVAATVERRSVLGNCGGNDVGGE